MHDRWINCAGAAADVPLGSIPNRRATRTSPTGASGPAPARRRFRWSLARALSAVYIVVGIQILICADGGIDFDIQASAISPSYGATARLADIALRPAGSGSHAAEGLRPVGLIRVADGSAGVEGTNRGSTDDRWKAQPFAVVRTDRAAASRDAAGKSACRRVTVQCRTVRSHLIKTLSDGIKGQDRKAALLGLFLLGVSDPKLRFGR